MPAPTKYPDWATDGTNVVEPPSGKKAAGWVPGEEPPSGWFNWWQGVVGQWTRWLDSQVIDALSRIAAVEPVAADAALRSVANTFAKRQTINSENGWADSPLLATDQRPGDDPTDLSSIGAAAGSNKWKQILYFPTDAGSACYVGFFVGQGTKRLALTYNARWHIPSQKWRLLDTARPAYAIVCRDARFIVSTRAAGAGPWDDWPETSGGGGDLVVNGIAQVGSHVYIADGVGEYNYSTLRARVMSIPLAMAYGNAIQRDVSTGWISFTDPANAELVLPIRLPAGAVLDKVEFIVEEKTTFQFQSAAFEYTPNFAASPPSVARTGGFGNATPSPGAGVKIASASFGNRTIDSTHRYEASLVPGASASGDNVRAARVTFTDPGPRTVP